MKYSALFFIVAGCWCLQWQKKKKYKKQEKTKGTPKKNISQNISIKKTQNVRPHYVSEDLRFLEQQNSKHNNISTNTRKDEKLWL